MRSRSSRSAMTTPYGLVLAGASFTFGRRVWKRFFDNVSIVLLDRDSLGILWYASGGGALSRIHEGKPEPSRWSGAGVSCILRDREGSLWLGGRGEPQVLRQLKPAAPASIDNPSFCVLPSETDGVWLGSPHGVAWMPVGMGWRAVSDDRFVIREATYALARGSEGSIWAGHRNGTISRWSKDGLETFLEPRRDPLQASRRSTRTMPGRSGSDTGIRGPRALNQRPGRSSRCRHSMN